MKIFSQALKSFKRVKSVHITTVRFGNSMSAPPRKRPAHQLERQQQEPVKKIKTNEENEDDLACQGAETKILRKKIAMLLCYSGSGYYGMLRQKIKEHDLPPTTDSALTNDSCSNDATTDLTDLTDPTTTTATNATTGTNATTTTNPTTVTNATNATTTTNATNAINATTVTNATNPTTGTTDATATTDASATTAISATSDPPSLVYLKTIEGALLDAMLAAGCVSPEGYRDLFRCKFQRASRTDKGVSALRQVVSFKALLVPDLVDRVNQHLPEQIRVIAYKRVTRAFDSKVACCARTYGYLLPTFSLAPWEQVVTEGYRATPHDLQRCQRVLDRFMGAQNFHNYTSGKKHNDRSAVRFIREVKCNEPFTVDGIEFVKITIKGQSFMLHQIRKMIAVMIAICRGIIGEELMDKAKEPGKLDLPKAPALGLMLEQVHYDAYNKRYGDDGIHERLDWNEYEEQINAHAKKHIYPYIMQTEKNQKSMFEWLKTICQHTFDVTVPGPPRGIPGALSTLKHYRLRLDKQEGEVAEAGAVAEAGVEAEAGAVAEAVADTGAVAEAEAEVVAEAGAVAEAVADTGAVAEADTGVVADIGAVAETGVVADIGAVAESVGVMADRHGVK